MEHECLIFLMDKPKVFLLACFNEVYQINKKKCENSDFLPGQRGIS